jgi:hypothetical protein
VQIVGEQWAYLWLLVVVEDDEKNHLSRFKILSNLIHDSRICIVKGLKFFG